ncbi:armadillo repeat-containing protein 8 isoform X1 [Phoenix dactylifera]|uniref:Armadillo repeat-containing protein 8 isoform X1 n=1 Tax=Phoenix dactylifera TaxID=42345 RepID=A0A8B8JAM1_PHODC|nr:armadillo repeat-containing protein 8 isoform X1 [Phoenix dactylifera]
MPASATANRPEELVERLGVGGAAAEGEALLKALREVKNQIIGNKTKKLLYLHLGAVPRIVSVLASAEGGGDAALIVQAAAAIGSFACGVEDGVRAVLDADAVPQLTRILSYPDEKVVDAGARSLRMIFQSKLTPKYDVLQEKNMKFLLSLLYRENENVTELAASIIAHSCERHEEQKALCDAGVLQRLVKLLGGPLNQRDACLESIEAIVRNNSEVAQKFACIDNGKALSSLIELIQDRYPRTRLLACICLIAIRHASPCYVQEMQIKTKLILILIELLEEPGKAGDEAPFALTNLIMDEEELHKQAISINAVEKLCNFFYKGPIEARRLQGILLALAELCSKLEKCRSQLISLQVLNFIVDALKHDCTDVRTAACSCIRNISRSLKNLSAGHLSSETVVVPLVQLLHDESSSVQVAALGAICNVAVNFATRKSVFIQCGGVSQLVQLAKSMDSTLRLKSVWALRNLMFLADRKDKECVLMELTVSNLASLICDSEHPIQEQALTLVSNLIDGCGDTFEHAFAEDSAIINALTRILHSASSPGVCMQACNQEAESTNTLVQVLHLFAMHSLRDLIRTFYRCIEMLPIKGMFLLANIAAGNEFHKEVVLNCLVPPQPNGNNPSFIIKFLQSKENLLRVASVWCIVNLTYRDGLCSSTRVARLRDAGIISQIKTMVNDPCLDCKLRVRMALEQCMDFENSEHVH